MLLNMMINFTQIRRLKMRAFPLSHSELQMKITPTAMIFRALSSRYGAGAVKALLDVHAKLSFKRPCSMKLLQKNTASV